MCTSGKSPFLFRFLIVVMLAGLAACSSSSTSMTAPKPTGKFGVQQVFASPEDAVKALIVAVRDDRPSAIIAILGPHSEKLVHSGDRVADRNSRDKFLAAYDSRHKLLNENDGHVVLVVGEEEWPLPFPLLHEADGWRFDAKIGGQEILNRRIGRNELNVIQVARAYVDAQNDFADTHPLGHGEHEYAQKFISTPGEHDGLYWDDDGNGDGNNSPLGPLFAHAQIEGYNADVDLTKHTPFHGYYFKILEKQGEHAPGGAREYIRDGRMTGGFALLAFPARYGDSGVMSFIIGSNGILYERNLGANTDIFAPRITEFDPDSHWEVVP